MLNVTGLGRLTKEPELRYTQTGVGVCTMSVAFDTTYNKADKKMNTTFLNVTVWNRGENKLADRCADWLQKGSQVLIEGTLNVRNYEAKDGSGKRYVTELNADKVHFIGAKSAKNEQNADTLHNDGILDFSDFGQEILVDENPLPF
jgi:single-strand DNA-binding protein